MGEDCDISPRDVAELRPMMSTESDHTSENSHQEPGSAEESQRAGIAPVWPDREVPTWSAPSGLIASQAACPETSVASPVAGSADNHDWPGVAPPAGWFLRSAANGSAGRLPEPNLAAANGSAGRLPEPDL